MTIQFITLTRMTRGNENDTSSLLVKPDRLEVVGVLPHNTSIKPHTREDAQKLLDWLLTNYPGLIVSIHTDGPKAAHKYAEVRQPHEWKEKQHDHR